MRKRIPVGLVVGMVLGVILSAGDAFSEGHRFGAMPNATSSPAALTLPVLGGGWYTTELLFTRPVGATGDQKIEIPGVVCSPDCDFSADLFPGQTAHVTNASYLLKGGDFGTVLAPDGVISRALVIFDDGTGKSESYSVGPLQSVDAETGLSAAPIVSGGGFVACVTAFPPTDQVLSLTVFDGGGQIVAADSIQAKAPVAQWCTDQALVVDGGRIEVHLETGFGGGNYKGPVPVPIVVTSGSVDGGNAAPAVTEPIP